MRRVVGFVLQTLAVAVLCPGVAEAQTWADLKEGSRVRVWSVTEDSPIRGSVIALADDRITIAPTPDGEPVTIPTSEVARVDLSVGKRRNAWRGALAGAFVGYATMFVLAVCIDDGESSSFNIGAVHAAGTWFGAPVGALAGAAVGFSIKTDRWQAVAPSVTTGPPPSGGRLSVAFAVRF